MSSTSAIAGRRCGCPPPNGLRGSDWQIRQGTQGLVPVGTTGESATLSHAKHRRIIDITVEVTGCRVPVIAGAGSNSTAEAIDLARRAAAAGADAILAVDT